MTMFGLFGAPFGIFIASLIMDKIPRRVMGVILLAAMAVLGVITGQQTTMTALIVTTFLLNTAIYMYVCYASAVYVPEMWPTSAKLSGSGFCNAIGRVSNIFFPVPRNKRCSRFYGKHGSIRPDLCCCRNNRSMYFDLRRRD